MRGEAAEASRLPPDDVDVPTSLVNLRAALIRIHAEPAGNLQASPNGAGSSPAPASRQRASSFTPRDSVQSSSLDEEFQEDYGFSLSSQLRAQSRAHSARSRRTDRRARGSDKALDPLHRVGTQWDASKRISVPLHGHGMGDTALAGARRSSPRGFCRGDSAIGADVRAPST